MNLANRILTLRKQKGFSQEELAHKIGVSRQAVSKWESEQSVPDIDKIVTMSELFEVSTDYILKGVEPFETSAKESLRSLNIGFVAVFATIAGIWSFAANQFRDVEIILITLAGGIIGLGVSMIFQTVSRLFKQG